MQAAAAASVNQAWHGHFADALVAGDIVLFEAGNTVPADVYPPRLQPIFRSAPLSGAELGICVAVAAVVYLAIEAEKAWRRGRTRRAGA